MILWERSFKWNSHPMAYCVMLWWLVRYQFQTVNYWYVCKLFTTPIALEMDIEEDEEEQHKLCKQHYPLQIGN